MKNTYTISEFAKMCNVTPRTLKYYEEIGLLKPSEVLENGYRLYNPFQLDEVSSILLLKDHGFSLMEIKEIMNNKNLESHFHSLQLQKKVIEERMQILQKKEKMIDYTMYHMSMYFKHQTSLFEEVVEKLIDIEPISFERGELVIIMNYLTDGVGSGIVFQEDGKVIGMYKISENGKERLCGNCICCYSLSSANYVAVIERFKEYAKSHQVNISNIYQETILEWAQSNMYLVKYYMCIEKRHL